MAEAELLNKVSRIGWIPSQGPEGRERVQQLNSEELVDAFAFLLTRYDESWAWDAATSDRAANCKRIMRYLQLLELGHLIRQQGDLTPQSNRATRALVALVGKLESKHGAQLYQRQRSTMRSKSIARASSVTPHLDQPPVPVASSSGDKENDRRPPTRASPSRQKPSTSSLMSPKVQQRESRALLPPLPLNGENPFAARSAIARTPPQAARKATAFDSTSSKQAQDSMAGPPQSEIFAPKSKIARSPVAAAAEVQPSETMMPMKMTRTSVASTSAIVVQPLTETLTTPGRTTRASVALAGVSSTTPIHSMQTPTKTPTAVRTPTSTSRRQHTQKSSMTVDQTALAMRGKVAVTPATTVKLNRAKHSLATLSHDDTVIVAHQQLQDQTQYATNEDDLLFLKHQQVLKTLRQLEDEAEKVSKQLEKAKFQEDQLAEQQAKIQEDLQAEYMERERISRLLRIQVKDGSTFDTFQKLKKRHDTLLIEMEATKTQLDQHMRALQAETRRVQQQAQMLAAEQDKRQVQEELENNLKQQQATALLNTLKDEQYKIARQIKAVQTEIEHKRVDNENLQHDLERALVLPLPPTPSVRTQSSTVTTKPVVPIIAASSVASADRLLRRTQLYVERFKLMQDGFDAVQELAGML